jgi:hypothetical protein
MPKGLTVTVAWIIKPEVANEFVETLLSMTMCKSAPIEAKCPDWRR